jgi:hypothetical protein
MLSFVSLPFVVFAFAIGLQDGDQNLELNEFDTRRVESPSKQEFH